MKPAFDVKSARLDVLAVQLHTADLTELEEFLRQRTGQYRELDVVPFILDVQDFDHPESLNTGAVVSLFARYGMQILGLRHTSEIWAPYAAKLHLVFTLGDSVPAEPQPKAATPAPVQTPAAGNPTVLVSTPVRTGQQVYAENADLIVTGAVSQGAELIADGNIHVYAPMRGRALAGPCRRNWYPSQVSIETSSRICPTTCIKNRCRFHYRTTVWSSAQSTRSKTHF